MPGRTEPGLSSSSSDQPDLSPVDVYLDHFKENSNRGSPPPTPLPWRWRCHGCGSSYSLSCTSRCLECSHTICYSVDGDGGSSARKRRHRRGGPCKSEFDYIGWAAWGCWRRCETSEGHAESATAKYLGADHNCAVHCDHPSQCHQARQLASPDTTKAHTGGAGLQLSEEQMAWAGFDVPDSQTCPDPDDFATTAALLDPEDFDDDDDEMAVDRATEPWGDGREDGGHEAEDRESTVQHTDRERRSTRKARRLMGLSPDQATSESDLVPETLQNAAGDTVGKQSLSQAIEWWDQHEPAHKRRKRISDVLEDEPPIEDYEENGWGGLVQ